jgi:hypothetical protein
MSINLRHFVQNGATTLTHDDTGHMYIWLCSNQHNKMHYNDTQNDSTQHYGYYYNFNIGAIVLCEIRLFNDKVKVHSRVFISKQIIGERARQCRDRKRERE